MYGDKLVDNKDIETFKKLKFEMVKSTFDVSVYHCVLCVVQRRELYLTILSHYQEMDDETIKVEPLIFCHFAQGIGEPKYLSVPTWESLNKTLVEALDSYNEVNAVMNLVLFEDAMQHV